MAFQIPEDIANRALQHVGARRIASLSDLSPQAAEISFCYDKLRRAELRRTVWRFATRRAMLRAITLHSSIFVPPTYNPATAYLPGQLVMDSAGIYWIALFATTGNPPGGTILGQPAVWQQYFGPLTADAWSASNTYNGGEIVYVGSLYFLCVANGVKGVTPGTDSSFVSLLVGNTLPITFPFPAGPGMTVNTRQRNVFFLPYGFMRLAAPDPRVESTENLEVSAALRFNDWTLEGNLLISNSSDPILLRYVADVSDVKQFDDLFAEALSARIAYEVCERLTQSPTKLQQISVAYQKFIADARLVNWIETASNEPEEPEYQLVKVGMEAQPGRKA